MGRRKKAYDYIDALKKIAAAGLEDSPAPNCDRKDDWDDLLPLEERTKRILGLVNNHRHFHELNSCPYHLQTFQPLQALP